jgi:peptide/nickel transport system substrate-binding protein
MTGGYTGSFVRAVACLFGLTALPACGGGPAGVAPFKDTLPLPEEPMVTRMASAGAYGGRFVIAQTSGPRTFNALMANETSSTDLTQRVLYSGLTDFDNQRQEMVPMLATKWELAADGLTWTFHLRKGAAFSDGHPITAEDVLFSFAVAYDETVHPAVQDLLIMNGKKWEIGAPDPQTIVIKTPAPNAMTVELAGSVWIMPKHVLEPAFRNGTFASAYNVSTPPEMIVTSGPFRVQQYVAGEKTVVTRNPYWYGVDSRNRRLPYLDELVYLIVPDQDAADLKFRSGEVDGLDGVKPENYHWYDENQQQGQYTVYNLGPALTTNYFWFNLNRVRRPVAGKKLGDTYLDATKYGWFSNPVFRRAVSMAVDRDALVPSVFFGEGVKNWSTTTAGDKVWHSDDIVKYDYNPDEAKKLIASLGWRDRDGDGFVEDTAGNTVSFTMKTNSDNKVRVAIANFIRDDLAKIGIKMTLVPLDFNTLITNLREDFQYEAILLGLQSGVPPGPGQGQNVWRSSGRTHNWNAQQPKPETPQEARIDALMDVIVGSTDLQKRKDAWKEIQNIVNEQCWMIWLPTLNAKVPVRNRFGNLEPSVIPHRLLWNIDRVYVKALLARES